MTTGDPKGFRFRESTRAPFKTQVQLRFEKDGEESSGYSANVSMEGLFVETNEPRPVGTLVQFEFDLEGQSIQGLGDVVWIRTRPLGAEKPPGMGVQFRYIDPQSRDLVFRIVDRYLKESKDADSAIPAPGSGMPAGGAIGVPPIGATPNPAAPPPSQVAPGSSAARPATQPPPAAVQPPPQPPVTPPKPTPPSVAPQTATPPETPQPPTVPGAPQATVRLDQGEIDALTGSSSPTSSAGPPSAPPAQETPSAPVEPSLSGLPDSIDLSLPPADSPAHQDDLDLFQLEEEPSASTADRAADLLHGAPPDAPTVPTQIPRPVDETRPEQSAPHGFGDQQASEHDLSWGEGAASVEAQGLEQPFESEGSPLSRFDINQASTTTPPEPTFGEPELGANSGYFEEMIAEDSRSSSWVRRLIPLVLVLLVLGAAGWFLKDRILGLFGGGGSAPTEVAEAQPTEATTPEEQASDGGLDEASESVPEDPIEQLEQLDEGFDEGSDEFDAAGDGFLEPEEDLNADFSDDGFGEGFEDEPAEPADRPAPRVESRPPPRATPPPVAAANGMSINSISTATAASGTVVTIDASRDLSPSGFSVLRLDGPPRLLVRISGVSSPHDSQGLRAPEFNSVRAGLHDTAERGSELHLVFDLSAGNIQADSEVVGGNLTLRFRQN